MQKWQVSRPGYFFIEYAYQKKCVRQNGTLSQVFLNDFAI